MSYSEHADKKFAADLARLKELGGFKRDRAEDPENYFQLASHQGFVQAFLNPHTPWRSIHLQHACHSPGTRVLMADGRVRACEDLRVGDVLAGEYAPVSISGLHSGVEEMYSVATSDGRGFECNLSHIMPMVLRRGSSVSRVDMTLGQYLELRASLENHDAWIFAGTADYMTRGGPTVEEASELGMWARGGREVKLAGILTWPKSSRLAFLKNLFGVGGDSDRSATHRSPYKKYTLRASPDFLQEIGRACWSCGIKCTITRNALEIIWPSRVYVGARPQPKYTLLKFTVDRLGPGEYRGFTLDGCPRYFLADYIISHNTGVGKTIGGIAPTTIFAQVYQTLYSHEAVNSTRNRSLRNYSALNERIPNIFIFGFDSTKKAFIRDLLRYPKFGFVSSAELEELAARNKLVEQGVPGADESARDYYNSLKRRVFRKSHGGFVQIYGYDQIVNHLFITDLKLTDLEIDAESRGIDLDSVIAEHIGTGKIVLNTKLLESFNNSVLICDEIHNTYNSVSKNSRGVAIKYLLDAVPSLRLITLTATPMNNSPAEFVELADYHVRPDQRMTRQSLFGANGRTITPESVEKIREMSRGWISHFRDDNPDIYPSYEMVGSPMPVSGFPGLPEVIPYLKFVTVVMSEYHQKTLEAHSQERLTRGMTAEESAGVAGAPGAPDPDEFLEGLQHYVVATDSYSLLDIAFPSEPKDSGALIGEVGWYRSGDLRARINAASDDWRQKVGILVKVESGISLITGTFLALPGLAKYSAKYARLVEDLFAGFRAARGDPRETTKSLIYHNRVKISGVVLIQEILKENGILDTTSAASDFTMCLACGLRRTEHRDHGWYRGGESRENSSGGVPIAEHAFIAARFDIVHAEIDRLRMTEIMDDYNAHTNYLGHHCAIMVGSKIIRESYEFKDVRALYVVNPPLNISMLRQIFGRVIRNHSHRNLPRDKRSVAIHLLVHVVNLQVPHEHEISPEIHRYAAKMSDYLVIQQVEKIMNEVAVDANIHRGTIMSRSALKEFFPDCPQCWDTPEGCSCRPTPRLEGLYYEPENASVPATWSEASFLAYGGNFREIEAISYVIKRLFINQPVWTYDSLLTAVRDTRIKVPSNPKTYSEDSFIVALKNIVDPTTRVQILNEGSGLVITPKFSTEELLTDHNQRIIRRPDGDEFTVHRVGQHYLLVPLGGTPDVDCFSRKVVKLSPIRCNIQEYITAQPPKDILVWDKFWESRSARALPELGFLLETPAFYQEHMVRSLISGNAREIPAADYTLGLLRDLNVLIFPPEIRRYKSVYVQFSWHAPDKETGEPKTAPADTAPIGYTKDKQIYLYDAGQWIVNNRTILNRQFLGKEDPVIVGVFQPAGDVTKFKIRPPAGTSGRATTTTRGVVKKQIDFRTVERGIVCVTKNKAMLLDVARRLGVDVGKQPILGASLCDRIAAALLAREIQEVSRGGIVKHVYGWWDDPPTMNIISSKK